jgi:hypothetical protein
LSTKTNYFENQLLPNDLIIVSNHGDDEEDEQDNNWVLERQGDVHINVEIQSKLEILRVQLRVQDHLSFKLMYRTHTKSDVDVLHMH